MLWGCALTAGAMVAGACISEFAEDKPKLKNVKDRLSKTGEDFVKDCKKVGQGFSMIIKSWL